MTSKVGFFFDFDGTLVDNVSIMRMAYHSFMDSQSLASSDEEFDRYNGIPLRDFLYDIKKREKLLTNVEDLLENYFKVLNVFYENVLPREGVEELFQNLKAKKIPLCIVTSSTRKLLTSWLSKNLRDLPSIPFVTIDDVLHGKPHPEPYMIAMKKIQCDQGYAVEDSVNGIKSASSAGLKTIYFSEHGHKFKDIEIYRTISSFYEMRDLVE